MRFEVYIDGIKVKEYPHRLQAVIYLILKGHCYYCRFGKWLDDRSEIREVKKMAEKALKWVGDHYIPYELPQGASCYENDMSKEVSCCQCGKKLPYGECYTSRTIHDDIGIGYAECGECYFSSLIKKEKMKDD